MKGVIAASLILINLSSTSSFLQNVHITKTSFISSPTSPIDVVVPESPKFSPSYYSTYLKSTSDDVVDVNVEAEPAKKRRGRPPKGSTSSTPAEEEVPPVPLTPSEALELMEKNWIDTHSFDEDEVMNTWEMKDLVYRKEPVERGKLVVVTGPMMENEGGAGAK
jgi:hypothetical protein